MRIFPVMCVMVMGGLSACSLAPSDTRIIDPDKLFAELDQPKVEKGAMNETLLKSALDAEKKGAYSRAISFYKQLLDADEENIEYAMGLARNLRKMGNFEPAEQIYTQVLEREPEKLEAMEGRGLALMARGEFQQASKQLSEVMKRDDGRWRTLNALGILFSVKGMFEEADAYFEASLEAKPKNSSVLNNMALARAMAQQYDDAIETGQRAAKYAKKGLQRTQVELNLAMVHASAGDLESAERIARKYYSGAQLKNNMGLYAHLAKDDALAKSYLNSALSGSAEHYQRAWENLDLLIEKSAEDKVNESSVPVSSNEE